MSAPNAARRASVIGKAGLIGMRIAWSTRRGTPALSLLGAMCALLTLALIWNAFALSGATDRGTNEGPIAMAGDGYVSSRTCRSCHPTQYDKWHDSYHRTMTQVATPETVLGDFDDVELSLDGSSYRLYSTEGRFWVEHSLDGSSARTSSEIVLLTGSHHMQVYWYDRGKEKPLGQLPFAYLTADRNWIYRSSGFLQPVSPTAFNEDGRWNSTCIRCHTTNAMPGFLEGGKVASEVAELGIACEACHGPAENHVSLNASPLRRYVEHFSDGIDPSIVQPTALSAELSLEVCSDCHGLWGYETREGYQQWLEEGLSYVPGGRHEPERWLLLPGGEDEDPRVDPVRRTRAAYFDGKFWPDGVPRVSGMEYNAVLGSPCVEGTERTMTCSSCHTMHQHADDPQTRLEWADDQLGAGMRGNRACLQCHESFTDRIEEHTHHSIGSEGSRCYNCHMPHTSYSLLKSFRNHQVTIPDVATSLETGRPNACNLCHLDRSFGWVAARLSEQYGIDAPSLTPAQKSLPASVGWSLAGDAAQRALLAWGMSWEPARDATRGDWPAVILGYLLDDPYDAVRYIAERSLRRYAGFEDFEYDCVPAPDTREPAAPGVFEIWSERRSGSPVPRALFSRTGGLKLKVVQQLLANRNNRMINLLE